ncbi:MAG: PhzF family phenazine biosynthesis protein [Selenomonadaceae bacterium]|nr:PhzF family phenazine biosynthesis protein [Selenomonadaceae bacterium]
MKQFIVDAFTEKIFGGNPAAVCVVENFPPEDLMQNIAMENNFSETAFVMRDGEIFRLRWFTPAAEVNFCGHATLATAFVLMTQIDRNLSAVTFDTLSGKFFVERHGNFFEMNFPAYVPKKIPVTAEMCEAVNAQVSEAYIARDLLMVLDSAETVEKLSPDMNKLSKLDGLTQAVTAAGENFDCVSRVFAPKIKVPEDPVTGSTHCLIAPYWANKLGKTKIFARQASQRGGILHCEVAGERVKISGNAVLFAVAELKI